MLIVDDDEAYLRTLERAMEGQSIDLITCNNAVEALVKVGSFKPHLIVLDILMPGMDGFQTAERLRESPETAEIKVVVVSGAMTDDMRARAKEAGIAAALAKPVNIEELIGLAGGLLAKASA
ncbi:MAG: response regulator [Myxococcota bacterium]